MMGQTPMHACIDVSSLGGSLKLLQLLIGQAVSNAYTFDVNKMC